MPLASGPLHWAVALVLVLVGRPAATAAEGLLAFRTRGKCSEMGLSHHQKNWQCGVRVAALLGRDLLVSGHDQQAVKHTQCRRGEPHVLDPASIYDIEAVRSDTGVHIHTAPSGVANATQAAAAVAFRRGDRPGEYAQVAAAAGEPFNATVLRVRETMAEAALVVIDSPRFAYCNHYWLCESREVYGAANLKFGPRGYLDLTPSAAIATAVDGIVRSLGGHGKYSAVHLRQGDRLTEKMANLRVPLITPQNLFSGITYMMAGTTPTVFVSTDRPAVLRDGPWALRLHTEYRVMTIHDMWEHVAGVLPSSHYNDTDFHRTRCVPYEVAWIEKLVLSHAKRFLSTERSSFDHAVQVLRLHRTPPVDLTFFGLITGDVGRLPSAEEDWGAGLASHWEIALSGGGREHLAIVDARKTAAAAAVNTAAVAEGPVATGGCRGLADGTLVRGVAVLTTPAASAQECCRACAKEVTCAAWSQQGRTVCTLLRRESLTLSLRHEHDGSEANEVVVGLVMSSGERSGRKLPVHHEEETCVSLRALYGVRDAENMGRSMPYGDAAVFERLKCSPAGTTGRGGDETTVGMPRRELPPPTRTWHLVTTVSSNSIPMAVNFIQQLRHIGMLGGDMHDNNGPPPLATLTMYAEDDEAYRVLSQITPSVVVRSTAKSIARGDHAFEQPETLEMMVRRVGYVAELVAEEHRKPMRSGSPVMLTDIDVIFLADPTAWIDAHVPSTASFVALDDGWAPNAGFCVFFSGTDDAAALTREWKKQCEHGMHMGLNDQTILGEITHDKQGLALPTGGFKRGSLVWMPRTQYYQPEPGRFMQNGTWPQWLNSWHGSTVSLSAGRKDKTTFTGNPAAWWPPGQGPVVVHNNFVIGYANKVARFKSAKMWRADLDLQIFVLTADRSAALMRLLESLRSAAYDGDSVQLVISIDKRQTDGWHDAATVRVAENFDWPHGTKLVEKRSVHKGVLGQWTSVWQPASDKEWGLILEDDLQVSPFYYRYLKSARALVQKDPHIGGVTLQRMTLVPLLGGKGKMPPHNGDRPYLYAQVGSWGFAPSARAWREFLPWVQKIEARAAKGEHLPTLPGTLPDLWYWGRKKDRSHMWTLHWSMFAHSEKLYTLVANPRDQRTLCSNWQLCGVHYPCQKGASDAGGRVDFELVEEWDASLDVARTPPTGRYGPDGLLLPG